MQQTISLPCIIYIAFPVFCSVRGHFINHAMAESGVVCYQTLSAPTQTKMADEGSGTETRPPGCTLCT